MKATSILAKYFGKLPGQTLSEFAVEVRALKEDRASYDWTVAEAAKELDVPVEE